MAVPEDTAVATGVDARLASGVGLGVGSTIAVAVRGGAVEVGTGVAVLPSPEDLQVTMNETAISTAIAAITRYLYPAGPALEVDVCGK